MDPFRERIENLLRQGKISPEEANKLLRALDNTGDTTSAPLTGHGAVSPPPPPTPPTPVVPPASPPRAAPTPPVSPTPPITTTTQSSNAQIDGAVAQLSVSITAGDINIRGLPNHQGITAHSNNGQLEVIRNGDARHLRVRYVEPRGLVVRAVTYQY